MSRRHRGDDFGVSVVGAIFSFALIAIVGAFCVYSCVHDARHCTRWQPYTYTVCQHFGGNKYGAGGTTVCTPVDSKRCTAWDDVPESK